MSVYLGTQLLSGVATNTISNAHSLFDFKWSDHIINEMSWLRSDTFSWQDGSVYDFAYNHLNADYNGGTSTTETVGSYTITYVLADDGHKITTDETTVANIYDESGVAWYYVLDTANTRFKLPRTKYGFEGLRDSVGKYVEAGLPNITGELTTASGIEYGTGSGAIQETKGSGLTHTSNASNRTNGFTFDASRSSAIYGNSDTVQPPATQMYLYFYVGQFSQSATEQTAGVATETLNGKLDLDAGNATSSTKETIVGWGMPDYNSGIALTANTQYTAPCDGFAYFSSKRANSVVACYGILYDENGNEVFVFGNSAPSTSNSRADASIFVPKGYKVTPSVNTSNTNFIMFYPLKGVV